ncbi:hypothetical protein NBRC116187_22640 [Halopseudomonas sabulinigri]|uniref:Lipoprotein n=1 Tax=Halopseudomonas sabulinigri TaxID=472181 RepID=A0ABP9ZR22_9GAMM
MPQAGIKAATNKEVLKTCFIVFTFSCSSLSNAPKGTLAIDNDKQKLETFRLSRAAYRELRRDRRKAN